MVGSCAFKALRHKTGPLKLPTSPIPSLCGGYATEMASKLIALARQSAEVRQVIAHTLPLQNASSRVLRRVGMTCVGAVVDPEDGNVWRWQLRVSRPSMTSTRVFRPGTAYLVALLMTLPSCLLADIYRWDTGAVIPGTAGIVPGPGVNLSGWASEQQNLMYADFSNGIDLSQSHLYSSWLQNARFTAANLESANLNAADLTNVDFRRANLVGANLGRAILTGVDLTDADVRDTSLWSATAHGFTPQQLYSTSSYQSHDLRNIRFWDDDLSGWDLAGQNLTGADFEDASLSNANLTGASLIRVNLEQTVLENTQLDLADLRRASAWSEYELSRASTINTILPDGGVQGLDLSSGQRLRVRDADLTITVHDTMRMGGGSALALVLPDGAWGSTIAFAPGIPVTLGGSLELTFDADVDVARQVGRTLQLFDWTGVAPSGTITVLSPYTWDLSRLYTTGEVTLVPEPGVSSVIGWLFLLFTLRVKRR